MSDSYRSYTLRTPSYHVAAALPVSIYEPAVYSAVDSYAINGHGFGFDSETHIKAIGEYLERYVVFRAIQSTATGRISEMGLSEAEQSALVKAIQQTCERDDLKGEIVTHVFKLVDVRRLETGDVAPIPLFSSPSTGLVDVLMLISCPFETRPATPFILTQRPRSVLLYWSSSSVSAPRQCGYPGDATPFFRWDRALSRIRRLRSFATKWLAEVR